MNPQSTTRELQPPSQSWLNKVTRRLSIRHKIGLGYAVAVGIAVLGTTFGVGIGNRYEQQASLEVEDAKEEMDLLNRLQAHSLQIQIHQQKFIYLLEKPEAIQTEKSHFHKQAVEFQQLWLKFQASGGDINRDDTRYSRVQESAAELKAAKHFLQIYKGVPEAYIQKIEEILKPFDSSHLNSQEIEAARRRFLDFTNSSELVKFDNLSTELNQFIAFANHEYEKAYANRESTHDNGFHITIASIGLSIAIAILFAIYISREIARPIQSTTQVAQEVTRLENFNLQAPVTTEDEVGALTTSLNQLIGRVQQLLEEQNAANQAKLIQSEKMCSLGRMVAGVAHEINNPLNFIYGNLIHTDEYIADLLAMLETYAAEIPHPPQAVQVQAEEIDLAFLKEDLPRMLNSLKIGAERARQIVLSLKDFSRVDESKAHPVDLHLCIDNTLLILNNHIKKGITLHRNYGNIPVIEGYMGLLYQVFMNLLSNAIDALQESNSEKQLTIITERQDQDWVVVKIADNGSGISPENQMKIFDTFFTTKPRGVGTGLGLAISHQIIVENHKGKITCHSEVGVGTEFAIALPIQHQHLRELSKTLPATFSGSSFLQSLLYVSSTEV